MNHVEEQRVRQACSELGRQLRGGLPGSAEDVLANHPDLASDSAAALEVIYTEFVIREELGQRPQPSDWYARFPQWRGDLQELFQVHEFVVVEESRLSRTGGTTHPVHASTLGTSERTALRSGHGLRDYEILEELGRGGMGVVYKARQLSLNRIVALKRILAGEYASPEEFARFRSEAAANAALQHPNIVQIFEVGEEEGEAFLAQEFVDGGTLQSKLAEWQADGTVGISAASAAGLIEVLARAVHFAHERGIVHRDLKPANVLLAEGSRSASGSSSPTAPSFSPKIADFGLAKTRDAADLHVTHTGAILGTPSYMAPEQVAGAAIGPATDLHALGSLLYELLTGRPPYRGATVMETLEQVQHREPLPPSRLQPTTPRDLETICVKCLEKEPARRYVTAEALADDLARFLKGEPIIARPAGTSERMRKWALRKPAQAALVLVSTAAVVIMVTGAFLSNAALRAANNRERERARQAEHQQKVANSHRETAERHFREARGVVDRLTQISNRLAQFPRGESMRREILGQALLYYQGFLKEKSEDPEVQLETARASARAGSIQQDLGLLNESLTSFQQCMALLQGLVKQFPTDAKYQFELASGLRGFGLTCNRMQRPIDSEAAYREAAALLGALARKSPNDDGLRLNLANTLVNRCVALIELDRFQEAEKLYDEAIAIHKDHLAKSPQNFAVRRELAISYDDLGDLYWTRRRAADAEDLCRLAFEMRTELVRQTPANVEDRSFLARSCRNLAKIYAATGRNEMAVAMYGQAIELCERLRDEHPDVPGYSGELTYCLRRRYLATYKAEDYDQATQEYRRMLRINPTHVATLNGLSWHLATGKQLQPAEAREAVALAQQAVKQIPEGATYWNTLGVAHYRVGEWREAIAALQKSIDLSNDQDISNWFFLAMSQHQLGDADKARRWLRDGLKLLEDSSAPNIELDRFRAEAAALLQIQK